MVGGGNSAGQAALFLARYAGSVELLVRRDGLHDTMSRYLVDRIEGHRQITVRTGSQFAAVRGDAALTAIDVVGPDGARRATECGGQFCFIGADAATGWLPPEVQHDPAGFILTDRDLPQGAWTALDDRPPLPYESSAPGIFAAGDVRYGSTKRVASAVGEGAGAISSAHRYLEGLPTST